MIKNEIKKLMNQFIGNPRSAISKKIHDGKYGSVELSLYNSNNDLQYTIMINPYVKKDLKFPGQSLYRIKSSIEMTLTCSPCVGELQICRTLKKCFDLMRKDASYMRKLGFGMIGLGLFKSGDVEAQIRREINFERHPQIYVSFADRTYNTNDAYFESFLCHELSNEGKMMLNEKTRDWILLHKEDHHWGLSFEHNEDWK